MRGAFRRWRSATGASVVTLFALLLPVLLGASAFGVDVGVFFLERRALQKAADAAALAAAVAEPNRAVAVATRMFAANGAGDAAFTLSFGRYRDAAAVARDARFEPGGPANAVSIEATRSVPTLFSRIFGRDSETVAARARAATTPVVSFAIGSRLAAADPPLADALARALIGTPLGLDVLDYRALARSRLRLDAVLRELAIVEGLDQGTSAADVLRRPVAFSAVLSAMATELGATGDTSGASALRKAARSTVAAAALRVAPGDLLGLDPGLDALRLDYPNDALAAKVSALGLLSAAITDRSIGTEASLGLRLPGLARADLGLVLGESEREGRAAVVGRAAESGPSAETAQARLRLGLRVDAGALVPGLEADIPFELVAAGAKATVLSATCSADPSRREVRLAVDAGLARLSLGRSNKALSRMAVDDTVAPAAIAALGGTLRIEVSGSVALGNRTSAVVTFRGSDIGSGTVKTVRTRALAESLVATLLGEARIDVRPASIGLGLPDAIGRSVRALVVGLAQPADAVIGAALASAGVGLGEADIRVDDLVCGHARLVG